MTIGQIIKKEREKRRLMQDTLANKIGTSKASIENWEKGKSYPSLINAICLSDVFEISLDELVGRNRKGN